MIALYDGVIHLDPFSAAGAAKEVLDKEMDDLVGVEADFHDYDWPELDADYAHWTVRPLERAQVWPLFSDKPFE